MKGLKENSENKDKVRYFLEVLSDISSRSTGDSVNKIPLFQSHLDKLNFKFPNIIKRSEIESKLESDGYSIKPIFANRNQLISASSISNNGEILFYRSSQINQIFCNPSRSNNWSDFLGLIEPLREVILESKVSRLDLALDLHSPFKNIQNQYLVKGLSRISKFSIERAKSTKDNAIRYGSNKTRQIEIYDKSLKSNLNYPLARVEERIKGRKVPCTSIETLHKDLKAFPIFKGLSFLDVEIAPHLYSLNNETVKLKGFIDSIGYAETRKLNNEHGNFDQKFSKYLTINKWEKSPKNLFLEGINNFFQN